MGKLEAGFSQQQPWIESESLTRVVKEAGWRREGRRFPVRTELWAVLVGSRLRLFDTGKSIDGQVNGIGEIEEVVGRCFQYQICVLEFSRK